MNPRKKIKKYIREDNLAKLLEQAAELHGHYCPGLALGIIAAQKAMKILQAESDGLEDLIAITETNNCFSDGIQLVSGCTFGNNALIFNDWGKTAFSLIFRATSRGIRIATIAASKEYIRSYTEEFTSQYKIVVSGQQRNSKDVADFMKYGKMAAHKVLELDFEKIFTISSVSFDLPDYAPSHESVLCFSCSEAVMITRVLKIMDKYYCIACSNKSFRQLNGNGIIIKSFNK